MKAAYLVKPFRIGMYEAMAMIAKLNKIGAGALSHCSLRPTPVTSSAAKADVTPSIARRPLMVSGAGPSKDCASADSHLLRTLCMRNPCQVN